MNIQDYSRQSDDNIESGSTSANVSGLGANSLTVTGVGKVCGFFLFTFYFCFSDEKGTSVTYKRL